MKASDTQWVNFLGGWSLPVDSPVFLNDAACASYLGPSVWDLVYAPAGWDPTTLCIAAWGTAEDLFSWGYDVYGCKWYK